MHPWVGIQFREALPLRKGGQLWKKSEIHLGSVRENPEGSGKTKFGHGHGDTLLE